MRVLRGRTASRRGGEKGDGQGADTPPNQQNSPSSLPTHTEHLHVKPGKGAAFVRTKLKNYITGNTMERTFRGGEPVDTADVYKTETQFTYVDGDEYVFMDNVSCVGRGEGGEEKG